MASHHLSFLSLPLLALLHLSMPLLADRLSLPVHFTFSPILNISDEYISFAGYGSLDSYLCVGFLGSRNFIFGVLFRPESNASSVYDLYFGVCLWGAAPNKTKHAWRAERDTVDSYVRVQDSNYATPVWMVNASRPLRSMNASLVVGPDRSLKVRDFDGSVLWSVSSVAAMELLDSGNLVLYDANNATIWQSFDHPTDTLLHSQSLRVGMQLTSKDSRYSMVMKPGALVFYLQAAQSWPYWILWLQNSSNISRAPCVAEADASATLDDAFSLNSGRCLPSAVKFKLLPEYRWAYVQLSNDGRLACYVSAVRSGRIVFLFWLDELSSSQVIPRNYTQSVSWPYSSLGTCYVPSICPPYTICSRFGNSSVCLCPNYVGKSLAFTPIDPMIGCPQYVVSPNCSSKGDSGSDVIFQQIKRTATAMHFFGANHPGTKMSSTDCERNCRSDCECPGVVYMTNTSLCFHLPINVSLINVSSSLYYSEFAENYVAYIKILNASRMPTPSASQIPGTRKLGGRHTGKRMRYFIVTALVIASVLVLSLLAGLVRYRSAVQKRFCTGISERRATEVELLRYLPHLPTRFSYRDLRKATRGFTNLLGEGAYGVVYAGILSDGRQVAVKKLASGRLQGKQFLAEVTTIGQTSHFNIVPLVGFCLGTSRQMLVYEFMEKGSLDRWLFNVAEEEHFLDWAKRCSIAIGVARGLAYLHEDCQNSILHLDIKPQNILLDNNFVPKLADFGLSRLISRDISRVLTMGRGTPGYMAPELSLSEAAVSKKSDVYSLGMVLLEIVGGRKNIDISLLLEGTGREGEWHFPTFVARKCEEGKLADLVDPRLQGAYQKDKARSILEAAIWCIQEHPNWRPSAGTLCKWLEGSAVHWSSLLTLLLAILKRSSSIWVIMAFVHVPETPHFGPD